MRTVLGLDVGDRRIGVAVGHADVRLALPLTTIIRNSDRAALAALQTIVKEHDAEAVVVGLPLHADGSTSEQSRRTEAFARKLRALPKVRVVFWDERFSTSTAGQLLAPATRGGAPHTAKRRETDRRRLDAAAAAVILQDYLDQQPAENPCASS